MPFGTLRIAKPLSVNINSISSVKQLLGLSVLLIVCLSCSRQTEEIKEYPNQIGDISFDATVDDANFKICNPESIYQYYNFGKGLQYIGEKSKINEIFNSGFEGKEIDSETGFLTIRFVVNCEGKTGRFRVQGMDNDYKAREFDTNIVQELLRITKSLDGWVIGGGETNKVDYYQYLTFKLLSGHLIEIMP